VAEKDGRLMVFTYEVEGRGIRFLDGLTYSNDITFEQLDTSIGNITSPEDVLLIEVGNNVFLFFEENNDGSNQSGLQLVFNKERAQSWFKLDGIDADLGIITGDNKFITYSTNTRQYALQNSGTSDFGNKIEAQADFKSLVGANISDKLEMDTLTIYGKNLDDAEVTIVVDRGQIIQTELVKAESDPDQFINNDLNDENTDQGNAAVYAFPDEQTYETFFTTDVNGKSLMPRIVIKYDTAIPEIYRVQPAMHRRRFR